MVQALKARVDAARALVAVVHSRLQHELAYAAETAALLTALGLLDGKASESDGARRTREWRDREEAKKKTSPRDGPVTPGDVTETRHGDVTVTPFVTSQAASRPVARAFSDQDLTLKSSKPQKKEERESAGSESGSPSVTARATRDPVTRGDARGDAVGDVAGDVRRDAPRAARETSPNLTSRAEPRLERDDDDEPVFEGVKPLNVQLWEAWGEVVFGGLPAGSSPRTQVFECCDVLEGRGLGVEAFTAAATRWVAEKRAEGTRPNFTFFARDLAVLLEEAKAPPRPRSRYDNPELEERMRRELAEEAAESAARGPSVVAARPPAHDPEADLAAAAGDFAALRADDDDDAEAAVG